MVVRDPERVELGPVPSRAHAEPQPSTAELVHRGRLLGEHRRIVEVQARDEGTELDPLRDRGETGQERPGLPRSPFPPLLAVEVVIAQPDRVEPDLFRRPGHRRVLVPSDAAFDLRELDADAQPVCHPPDSMDP